MNQNNLINEITNYDQILPSTRKIFHQCFIPLMASGYEKIFPSHSTIAKMSGLGTTQVKKCIQQAVDMGILKVHTESGKRTLLYEVMEGFLEACLLIQACRFMDWKKHRENVLNIVSEDELSLAKILQKRGQLSTTKVSTCLLSKVSTIRILSSSMNTVRIYRDDGPREQVIDRGKNPKPIQEGSPYLFGLRISERDKVVLTFKNSPEELKSARETYDFIRYKRGIFIEKPAGFMINQINKKRREKYAK